MKWIRVILSLTLTIALIWFLDNQQTIGGGTTIPPLGRFLNPEAGFWQNAEAPTSAPEHTLELPVRNAVTVLYDSLLIPHIFAENNYDAYFAQGYVTAQHRLWQMEFQTHFAAGRISELVGEKALSIDRTSRRLGFVEAAEQAVENMRKDPAMLECVEAYTAGINAYIASLTPATMPMEYKLLAYEPENWSALKTGLLLIYMGNSLTARDRDLQNTNMLKLLGKERFDLLYPDYPAGIDPVIPESAPWDFEPLVVETPEVPYYDAYTQDIIDMADEANGSNNWAVNGQKSLNGNPILANDPHLGLNLPSLWYMIQISAPGLNVKGASLPGAPGVIIGFTDSVAWGVTNGTQDVRDWYAIQFRDESREEYLYNGDWLKTQVRVESIKMRGVDEPYLDTVYLTHHGPVVYDDNFPGDGDDLRGYAARWTLHMPREELRAFYLLNRAQNVADYDAALPYYGIPSQNFVFASAAGDIAIWQQGDIPLRFPEQGKFLMDGSTSETFWNTFIPPMQNPRVVNPEENYVSSANQISAGTSYPYYILDNGFEDYRNRRINMELSGMDSVTVEDMMALQMDNYSLKAAENLPLMLDSLVTTSMSADERNAYEVLSNWDYYYDLDAAGAVLFNIWWDTLMGTVWDEFQLGDLAVRLPDDYRTSQLIREIPEDTLFDVVATTHREDAFDVIRMSFSAAVSQYISADTAGSGTWGPYKTTTITHLSRQAALSVSGLETGGYRQIVNATSEGHGPSWRMVVELGDQPVAYGVYPGGQSGNPGSPYYDNLIETWRTGNYYPLPLLHRPDSTGTTLVVQQITPQN